MAGFYAKKANPPLHVTPLVKETTGPRLAYRIGMARAGRPTRTGSGCSTA